MEIRKLEPDELALAHYVWSQAFERGDREMRTWHEWEARLPERRSTYGVFDENGLQATVLVVRFDTQFGPEAVLPMGALCGVASLPAARGKGYAGACVRHALEQMRADGVPISVLDPFSFEFYRKLGWGWVGERRRYCVPTDVLQADTETERVRAAGPSDRAAILEVYTRYSYGRRGMLIRRPADWDAILDHQAAEHTYSYLYEVDGRLEGYFTFRGGSRKETVIRELIANTPRALRGLLGLMRRHAMQTDSFVWKAPTDDPLWNLLTNWDVETTTRPLTMGRIVDVPTAIASWRPGAGVSGEVTVRVRDANAPWNDAAWNIEYCEGRAAARTTTRSPDMELDISVLSQAYFGTPTLEALRAADRMTVHNEEGYLALQRLLHGPPMWINDSF